MRKSIFSTSALVLATSALAEDLTVTSTANDGPGSLRAALQTAADSTDTSTIFINTNTAIELSSGLAYDALSDLKLVGNSSVINLGHDETILSLRGARQISLSGLRLQGPGGWSIENRSQAGADAAGIEIRAAENTSHDLVVHMKDVSVTGMSGHGIYVSDCAAADCKGTGSDASVSVFANAVHIENNGHGRYNADGLRVEEFGAGDLRYVSVASRYVNNGADGAELDEFGSGNLLVSLQDDVVDANGFYCNTDILAVSLPEVIEAEFDEGAFLAADLPEPVSGSADDACIEFEVDLYDDDSIEAYEFEIDVEDGFDVSERGAGSVYATMDSVLVSGNDDEGLDFDEYDAGDIYGQFRNNVFAINADDGLKLSERDDGNTTAFIQLGRATGNGDRGYLIEEEGSGDLYAVLSNVTAEENDDAGIEAVQEDDGSGQAEISESRIDNELELDGVQRR